jgi:hypothetical protein
MPYILRCHRPERHPARSLRHLDSDPKGLALPQIDPPADEAADRLSFGGFEAVGAVLEAECGDPLFEALARQLSGG